MESEEERCAAKSGLLTRGQMARLNQVSKKTLLVYEEKGLLEPVFKDEQTGYRFYSLEQCSLLDIIQQLQATGASLSDIREVLDQHDVAKTSAFLDGQIESLRQRQLELKIAEHNARQLKGACELRLNPPEFNAIRLVWMPRRRIARFPVKPYRFESRQTQENPRLSRWERALRQIKRDFPTYGLPLELFHNVGCIVSRESLESRAFVCPGGYIDNEEGFGTIEPSYWEEGYNLAVTIDTVFLPDGRHAEYLWLERMLDAAEQRGFSVRDDYHSDILAESPALRYQGRDMMLRMLLPVNTGASADVRPGMLLESWPQAGDAAQEDATQGKTARANAAQANAPQADTAQADAIQTDAAQADVTQDNAAQEAREA
jgi:DNA-binding transcriptional MerR regulator